MFFFKMSTWEVRGRSRLLSCVCEGGNNFARFENCPLQQSSQWPGCLLTLFAMLTRNCRPLGVVIQAHMVLLLYCGALAVQVRCEPYKASVLNRVELLAIVVIILTTWMGVLLSQSEVGDAMKQAMSIMIILVNVGALLVMLLAAGREVLLRHTAARASLEDKEGAADDSVASAGVDLVQVQLTHLGEDVDRIEAPQDAQPRDKQHGETQIAIGGMAVDVSAGMIEEFDKDGAHDAPREPTDEDTKAEADDPVTAKEEALVQEEGFV